MMDMEDFYAHHDDDSNHHYPVLFKLLTKSKAVLKFQQNYSRKYD